MSAVAAPAVELNVSEAASVEIKKFITSEEDLPETAGLRVRVVPGGCSGLAVDPRLGRYPDEVNRPRPSIPTSTHRRTVSCSHGISPAAKPASSSAWTSSGGNLRPGQQRGAKQETPAGRWRRSGKAHQQRFRERPVAAVVGVRAERELVRGRSPGHLGVAVERLAASRLDRPAALGPEPVGDRMS